MPCALLRARHAGDGRSWFFAPPFRPGIAPANSGSLYRESRVCQLPGSGVQSSWAVQSSVRLVFPSHVRSDYADSRARRMAMAPTFPRVPGILNHHNHWLSFPFSVPWVLQPCISEPASHRNTGRHAGHGVLRGSARPGQTAAGLCCCFLAAPCACLPWRSTMPGKRRSPSTLSQRNAATEQADSLSDEQKKRHRQASTGPAPCSKSPDAMRPRPRR